jgi:glycosyltransferase involved in cell wall biosynthesis
VLKIDIIAPVRDEGEILPAFVKNVMAMTLPAEVDLGIIFVEDGSRDRTVSALRELSAENSSVRFFSLRNDRGQAAAVAFGMKQSSAEAIIMMDADGSHPLQIVPEMIARFRSGADVVQAVRIESGQEHDDIHPHRRPDAAAERLLSARFPGDQPKTPQKQPVSLFFPDEFFQAEQGQAGACLFSGEREEDRPQQIRIRAVG